MCMPFINSKQWKYFAIIAIIKEYTFITQLSVNLRSWLNNTLRITSSIN